MNNTGGPNNNHARDILIGVVLTKYGDKVCDNTLKRFNQPRLDRIRSREEDFIAQPFENKNAEGIQRVYIGNQLRDGMEPSKIKKTFENAGVIASTKDMQLLHKKNKFKDLVDGFKDTITFSDPKEPVFVYRIKGKDKATSREGNSSSSQEIKADQTRDVRCFPDSNQNLPSAPPLTSSSNDKSAPFGHINITRLSKQKAKTFIEQNELGLSSNNFIYGRASTPYYKAGCLFGYFFITIVFLFLISIIINKIKSYFFK